MKLVSAEIEPQPHEGERRCLNSELWHACAGPLVSLPTVGSRVVYFPQGHSEQVAASTNKEFDSHVPNYPSLPPQMICQLHDVTMHADVETDEVYAKMTLQPLSLQEQKDPYLPTDLGTPSKQPTNYFCKTLTASDTSTHGGFSVPRRAAEKVFPPLDFSQQPPAQELIARDLHDNEWKFRHIFRGQPKRHLLTTGWSVFVSAKRLVAGDSVLFIWNDNNQLLLGIRHANRPQTVMPSSVLSSDSMHIGLLAAAAHASATNSRFTVFFNPRASASEFVIPLTKYVKALYHTRVSVGMRFRMLFETEESSVRRYMGTITGTSDLDPVRWPNSHWRSVKVGWDESTAGERQPRVSLWDIEPLTTFPMYPSPFPLRLKRPWPPGLPSLYGGSDAMGLNSPFTWLRDSVNPLQSLNFQGGGVNPWLQQRLNNSMIGLQPDAYQAMAAAALQEFRTLDPVKHASTLMQFQQAQSIASRPAPPLPSQVLPQAQPHFPQTFVQPIQDNHTQSNFPQHHLRHSQSIDNHQLPQHQQQILQHQVYRQNHISDVQLASVSQSQAPPVQTISPFSQPPNFRGPNSISMPISGNSPLHNILRPFSSEVSNSSPWMTKQATVESFVPSGAQCLLSQVEQFGSGQPNVPQHSVMLPSTSTGQENCIDPENNLLFGIKIDPSSLLNGIHNLRGDDGQTDTTTIPFAAANFLGTGGIDFLSNQPLTGSDCLEEPGFLHPPDTVDQRNQQSETFVKVYKSGSYGRSIDITRFNSYPELRRELERLFGLEGQLEDPLRSGCLEGQLEDPLRSGWQLVFVDQEDDVLLLGDDPWQEFVNNVWCIKILSPQEMQHMGTDGVDLPVSVSIKRLPSSGCDEFVSRQNSRNLSTGIMSGGSLDY